MLHALSSSTTFDLEFIHSQTVKPPATRGAEEGVSGAFGCNMIITHIRWDETRNRPTTSSDDYFFACLNPVQQGTQPVSGLRSSDFIVCSGCHDFLLEYFAARPIISQRIAN